MDRRQVLQKLHDPLPSLSTRAKHFESKLDIEATDIRKSKLAYFMEMKYDVLRVKKPDVIFFLDDAHEEHLQNMEYYNSLPEHKKTFEYKSILIAFNFAQHDLLATKLLEKGKSSIALDGKKKKKNPKKKSLRKKKISKKSSKKSSKKKSSRGKRKSSKKKSLRKKK